MKGRLRMPLAMLMLPVLAVGAERTELNPPPLNPFPSKPMHVSVRFDNPEDAKRYVASMTAIYINAQPGCIRSATEQTAILHDHHATVELPNESKNQQGAKFTLYIDRFNQDTCNLELVWNYVKIRDTNTGQVALIYDDIQQLAPGREYKETCLFSSETYPTCHYRHGMPTQYNRSVAITVSVSRDSALAHSPSPALQGSDPRPIDNF